ncbi:galactoside-binding lectin [Dictyocaulus viviparus]|uniref:Galectin n=1 Tax=Dictyocaulus viviparus TaxID=29172 RepID=A0A0D8Y590_DICVI|nr:galactoside-binding lectin [Dictyocaulus viviparus]
MTFPQLYYLISQQNFLKAQSPDYAISVPYVTKLGEALKAGQTLNIHGKINADANRVEVNLLNGAGQIDPGQAVLHISLRFDEKKIVMNSFISGVWGKEERVSLPFKQGQQFDLRVRVEEESMDVSCDGKQVHEFKHRLPYNQIQFLQIKGDCTLSTVHWGGRFYQIPWETAFPGGHLRGGQRIMMYGIPKGERWNLDLLGRGGDVLFHFNPRFKVKQIVRNSYKGGIWGKEEREGPFPFEKERGFDLTIENEPYSMQLFVNNERIGTFAHRTENPEQDYIGMRVDGEIEVTSIDFN